MATAGAPSDQQNPAAAAAAAAASGSVFSASRPAHPLMPQTKQYQDLETYAYQHNVQSLFHETLQQVFCAKPEDPLKFVVGYLQDKLEQRDASASAAAPSS